MTRSRAARVAQNATVALEATCAQHETDEPPDDDVPGWLRQQYRKALAKVWSDHMPIAVRLV